MDDKSLNTIISITFAIALVILLFIGLVYLGNFYDYPIGRPSDFGAFGSYFGGLATPLLTFLTVIPLVLTLVSQQRQFKYQQNTQWFQTYLQRFDEKVRLYENMAQGPIGFNQGADAIILKKIVFLDPHSDQASDAGDFLDTIPGLMQGDMNAIPKDQIGNAIYLHELANHGTSACNTLSYTFKYATKEDFYLLEDLQKQAEEILSELEDWKILTDQKALAGFRARIKIPDELKPS